MSAGLESIKEELNELSDDELEELASEIEARLQARETDKKRDA